MAKFISQDKIDVPIFYESPRYKSVITGKEYPTVQEMKAAEEEFWDRNIIKSFYEIILSNDNGEIIKELPADRLEP